MLSFSHGAVFSVVYFDYNISGVFFFEGKKLLLAVCAALVLGAGRSRPDYRWQSPPPTISANQSIARPNGMGSHPLPSLQRYLSVCNALPIFHPPPPPCLDTVVHAELTQCGLPAVALNINNTCTCCCLSASASEPKRNRDLY